MSFSDGISLLALAIACASLYYALRKDDNARQIKVIERKHQLLRLYDQCAESALISRLYIPVIANQLPPEEWSFSEDWMCSIHRRLEVQEKKFREFEKRITELRFGEQKEAHWRHVELEEMVAEANHMKSDLGKIQRAFEEKYRQLIENQQSASGTDTRPDC